MQDNIIERKTWFLWAALFTGTVIAYFANPARSTMPIYQYAALAWVDGRRIYELSGIGGFTYFPQAAILLVPFAVLPKAAGEIAWRFVSISIFAISIRSITRLVAERTRKDLFPLMSLVSIFVVWDCARNGQATLLMAAFMLLAVDDIARSRWRAATLWLCLSVSIKPLSIVLVLLIIAIERPMSWRLAVGLLLTALAPFLLQHPAYVIEQYRACVENMRTAAHVGVVAHGWTTPFTALRVFGLEVPEKVQTVIRLAAAAATLGLCFHAQKRYDPARSAIFVYSLAALYLILFSPRTENNTYAMLGPVAGYFLADAVAGTRYAEAGWLAFMVFVMIGSRSFERLVAPGREQIWLSPLMAAVLAGYVLYQLLIQARGAERGAPNNSASV